MVVLEPQWLLDAMSCPIRDFELHRLPQDELCRREMQKEWALLVSHSRLRLSLLSKLWADERFATHFEPLVQLMAEAERREVITSVLDEFEARVLPRAAELRQCVIHGDINDQNVLIGGDAAIAISFTRHVYDMSPKSMTPRIS